MTKLFFLSVIGIISYAIYSRNKLRKNFLLTTGKVTECRFLPKSGGNISLIYEYNLNSNLISQSSTRKGITVNDCNTHLLGKTFPVSFNPDDSELSMILMEPSDFEDFGYNFPDSLKWVSLYFKE